MKVALVSFIKINALSKLKIVFELFSRNRESGPGSSFSVLL